MRRGDNPRSLKGAGGTDQGGAFEGESGAGAPPGPPGVSTQDPMQQYLAQIQSFYDMLMKPLDPNDPYVKAITTMAGNAAGTAAAERGIQGPMSVNAVQNAVIQQGTLLQQQRQQQAAGLLGLKGTAMAGAAQLGEQQYEFNAQMNAAQAMRQYQQSAGAGSTVGSLLGGGLGLAAGALIPGAQPFIPQLMAGGASLGGGIGGQIGGGMSNGGSGYGFSAPPRPPTYAF